MFLLLSLPLETATLIMAYLAPTVYHTSDFLWHLTEVCKLVASLHRANQDKRMRALRDTMTMPETGTFTVTWEGYSSAEMTVTAPTLQMLNEVLKAETVAEIRQYFWPCESIECFAVRGLREVSHRWYKILRRSGPNVPPGKELIALIGPDADGDFRIVTEVRVMGDSLSHMRSTKYARGIDVLAGPNGTRQLMVHHRDEFAGVVCRYEEKTGCLFWIPLE